MAENESGDISDIMASMCVVEAQNMVYCRIYPVIDMYSDEELWRVACHEVIHVSIDRYVGYMRRRLTDLEMTTGSEEEVRLESTVDYLSKQLVKILPLNKVYGSGKMKESKEGGDVSEKHYSELIEMPWVYGGNTN